MIITPATLADFEPHIWPILKAVAAAGDTLVYPPDASFKEAQSFWMHPQAQVYVVRNDTEQVIGSYYLKPNQIGLGKNPGFQPIFQRPTFLIIPLTTFFI